MQLGQLTPEVDTHTHTIISGHAWSTITENCLAAKAKGMKGLCTTDHGPAIENGAPSYIPHSQRLLPPVIEGIRVYKGVEINILDHQGNLDIPRKYLRFCEFTIASIHTHIFPERAKKDENTEVYRKILTDPYIDMIGHADDPAVPCDFEALIEQAQRYGKLLELNNNSTTEHRPGSLPFLKEYIRCCKAHGQRVCVSSDAHFYTMVGNVGPMMRLLEEMEFPQELIVNLTKERFESYLKERKERLAAILD